LTRVVDLSLPEPERRLAASLVGRWNDLLYVPGPGFVSPLEPGLYASSFVVVLAGGPAVRVTTLSVPAFGGDLCRLRLEPLASFRLTSFGSFFEPARRGVIYTMSADRRAGSARPPDRSGWTYEGEPLGGRLGAPSRVRVLRERVRGGAGDGAFAWVADRGLALTGLGGDESLFLARPGESEAAVFLPAPALYRALLDPAAPAVPGATRAELLGHGDWGTRVDVAVELQQVGEADRA
jgi:hypothetical protein